MTPGIYKPRRPEGIWYTVFVVVAVVLAFALVVQTCGCVRELHIHLKTVYESGPVATSQPSHDRPPSDNDRPTLDSVFEDIRNGAN